jgi:hypothetical protein
MSSQNNNFMSTITKNPLVSGIVVVVVILIIILIAMKGRKESFSSPPSSNENIVENFPQSTPMNVMYSDASGNLGTTTDLGLQNLTVNGAIQANNRLNFVGTDGSKNISLDPTGSHLRFRSATDDNHQFTVHSGELPQYSRTGISIGKWVENPNSSINADKNINTDAQVNTMGRTNYPSGWGGGVRTFDLYGSGTLGWGNEAAALSTTIANGNIWTSGNLSSGSMNTGGDLILDGDNKWIFHTPESENRRTLYVAPLKDDKKDWNWDASTQFHNNGDLSSGGKINVHAGAPWAVPNGYMPKGSITIGDEKKNFGGGSGWTANTAGLMMECADTTEIAVHDAGTRVASEMFYDGPSNTISIGRAMGAEWGPSSVSFGGQDVFKFGRYYAPGNGEKRSTGMAFNDWHAMITGTDSSRLWEQYPIVRMVPQNGIWHVHVLHGKFQDDGNGSTVDVTFLSKRMRNSLAANAAGY